jgi:hypothetical protein
MTDVFKLVGGLFGFGGEDSAPETVQPVQTDPVAERKAMAELHGSGLFVDQVQNQPSTSKSSNPAIGKDGYVDFDLLFQQAGLEHADFTADQAIKLLTNVEKTIPAVITEVKQREDLLRNVIIASMTGSASTSGIVRDAQVRSETLSNLVRNRLDIAADFRQKAQEKIKYLQQQIDAAHGAIESADHQFSALSSACKERQAQYGRLIDLFRPSNQPETNEKDAGNIPRP